MSQPQSLILWYFLCMETNILKRIFFDQHQHWEKFKTKYGRKIRPIVIKEVEKFRDCGDIRKGFKLFVCEGCHDVRKVPYRCKGRFCTTCSVGESEDWIRLLTEDVLLVNHRHVIFTIEEGLRDVFLLHRHLLKDLMDAASKLITDFFKKKAKVTPGIISGLHGICSRIAINRICDCVLKSSESKCFPFASCWNAFVDSIIAMLTYQDPQSPRCYQVDPNEFSQECPPSFDQFVN